MQRNLTIDAPPRRALARWTGDIAQRSNRRLKVVLLCHYGRTGYNILRALHRIGAETFLLHDNRSRSLRFSRRCTVVHTADHIGQADRATVVELINDLHRVHGIDSVMAADVESLTFLSQIRDDLLAPKFPIAELQTLVALDNKWEFYKLCRAVGAAAPKTIFFARKNDVMLEVVESELRFPVIVKPVASYGQRGIKILADRAAFENEFSSGDTFDCGELIVQEYVDGRDWSLSVFARDGVVEHWTAWLCPDQLDKGRGIRRFMFTEFRGHEELVEAGRKIVAAANFSGVANFDARLDERSNTMKMFECNPRFFNRMLAARLCGLDFVRAGLPFRSKPRERLDEGCFYPWHDLLSGSGLWRLVTGRWKLSPLVNDLYEMTSDPLPPIMRKILREEARE